MPAMTDTTTNTNHGRTSARRWRGPAANAPPPAPMSAHDVNANKMAPIAEAIPIDILEGQVVIKHKHHHHRKHHKDDGNIHRLHHAESNHVDAVVLEPAQEVPPRCTNNALDRTPDQTVEESIHPVFHSNGPVSSSSLSSESSVSSTSSAPTAAPTAPPSGSPASGIVNLVQARAVGKPRSAEQDHADAALYARLYRTCLVESSSSSSSCSSASCSSGSSSQISSNCEDVDAASEHCRSLRSTSSSLSLAPGPEMEMRRFELVPDLAVSTEAAIPTHIETTAPSTTPTELCANDDAHTLCSEDSITHAAQTTRVMSFDECPPVPKFTSVTFWPWPAPHRSLGLSLMAVQDLDLLQHPDDLAPLEVQSLGTSDSGQPVQQRSTIGIDMGSADNDDVHTEDATSRTIDTDPNQNQHQHEHCNSLPTTEQHIDIESPPAHGYEESQSMRRNTSAATNTDDTLPRYTNEGAEVDSSNAPSNHLAKRANGTVLDTHGYQVVVDTVFEDDFLRNVSISTGDYLVSINHENCKGWSLHKCRKKIHSPAAAKDQPRSRSNRSQESQSEIENTDSLTLVFHNPHGDPKLIGSVIRRLYPSRLLRLTLKRHRSPNHPQGNGLIVSEIHSDNLLAHSLLNEGNELVHVNGKQITADVTATHAGQLIGVDRQTCMLIAKASPNMGIVIAANPPGRCDQCLMAFNRRMSRVHPAYYLLLFFIGLAFAMAFVVEAYSNTVDFEETREEP